MSLFTSAENSKSGLRHQFESFAAAAFDSATNASTAVFIGSLKNTTTYLWWENTLTYTPDGETVPISNDVAIYAVHPKADPSDVNNRLLWIEIGGYRTINYNVGDAPHIKFDAQTKFYASYVTGLAPDAGFLRMYAW